MRGRERVCVPGKSSAVLTRASLKQRASRKAISGLDAPLSRGASNAKVPEKSKDLGGEGKQARPFPVARFLKNLNAAAFIALRSATQLSRPQPCKWRERCCQSFTCPSGCSR